MQGVALAVPEIGAGVALILVAAFLLMVRFGAKHFLQALVDMLRVIPVIGGYIADKAQSMMDALISFLDAVISGIFNVINAWWNGIGIVIDDIVDAGKWLGAGVYDAFYALRHTVVPHLIDTVTSPINSAIDALQSVGATIEEELHAGIDAVETEIAALRDWTLRGIDDIGTRVNTIAHDLYTHGIDRIDHILDDIIPAIRGDIAALKDKVGEIADGFGQFVKDNALNLAWLATVVKSLTATQVIEGVESANRWRPKGDKLCALNMDEVDDLMGLLLPAFLNAEVIREIARVSAAATAEIAPAIEDMMTG